MFECVNMQSLCIILYELHIKLLSVINCVYSSISVNKLNVSHSASKQHRSIVEYLFHTHLQSFHCCENTTYTPNIS
jgi:hypothetical protein